MLRKLESPRTGAEPRAAAPRRFDLNNAPDVPTPVSLICGACGATGNYKVGTVILDPVAVQSTKPIDFDNAVGFSGYFHCRACRSGGPWELTTETRTYVMLLSLAALPDVDDVPIRHGRMATFDGHFFRYATDGEAHLKALIDKDPESAFLWVRLGNVYRIGMETKRAQAAYRRAIELDSTDIEAHGMLAQVLINGNRIRDAVPHHHAVLKHAREAKHVDKKIRRNLVRYAIENLLDAHAQFEGEFELFPTADPSELKGDGGTAVLELREIDLGSEHGLNDLCDMFLEPPRRRRWNPFRRNIDPSRPAPVDWREAPIHRETPNVGRNAQCPCGSGHKYKKCCGRLAS